MATSWLIVLCVYGLLTVHVSGQTPTLTGPTSGVLGSSVHLICTLPGSSAPIQILLFNRGSVGGSLCSVFIAKCSQFSANDGFSCGCVSGQTREFYLNISSLSLQDDDTWMCTYNGVNSNNISLSVYRQTPTLTGPTSGVLGSSVHLICTIPGNSAVEGGLTFNRGAEAGSQCTVNIAACSQFSAGNGYSCGCVSGQTREFYLNISSLRKQDDDTWRCSYSGVSSNISLSVYFLYRPIFTLDQAEVRENESVKLKCSTQSHPTTLLTVRNIDNDTVILQEETNELTYTIPRAQCLHNGSFICSGDNKEIGVLYSPTKYLNVLCSPRLDTRKAFKKNFSSGLDEIAYLLLNVISNPAPTFTWYLSNNQLLVPIPNITKHEVISTAKYSVLQIHVSHVRDYASYVVEATSNHVTYTMTFNLLPTGSSSQEASTDRFGMGIGIGIVIGIASVLPVIGIVVYVCLRRQKTMKEEPKENRETDIDMSSAHHNADNRATYSDLTNRADNDYEELKAQRSEEYEESIPPSSSTLADYEAHTMADNDANTSI